MSDPEPRVQTAPAALQAFTPEDDPSERRLATIILMAVAGATLVFVLMTQVAYDPDYSKKVEAMQDTAQWVAWVVLLAIQTATWLALIFPIWEVVSKSKARWSRGVVAYVGLILLLLAAPIAGRDVFDPTHSVQKAFEWRLLVLIGIGSIAGLVAATGVVRTGKEIHEADVPTSPEMSTINTYLDMRRRLLFLGGALALIVALGVLSTGGLRNTIVAMETARATEETAAAEISKGTEKNLHLTAAAQATARAARFGVELVWTYGLYYSFVLALVYLPAYLSLLALGRRIRDTMKPAVVPTDPDYDATKKVRDELDEVMQLKIGPVESLKAATLILVPIATSFASTLLGEVEIPG